MEPATPRIIRFLELSRTTGLARTSIYRLIKTGEFPAPLKLGERASGWRSDEVAAWVESRRRGGRS